MITIDSFQYNLGEYINENDVEKVFGSEIESGGLKIKIVGWNENSYELVQENPNLGNILTNGTSNCLFLQAKMKGEWESAVGMYYTYLPAQNHGNGKHRFILDRISISDSLYLEWDNRMKDKATILEEQFIEVFKNSFPSFDFGCEITKEWLDLKDEKDNIVLPNPKMHIQTKEKQKEVWNDIITLSDFGFGVFFQYGLNLPVTVDISTKEKMFKDIVTAYSQYTRCYHLLSGHQKDFFIAGYSRFLKEYGYTLEEFLNWVKSYKYFDLYIEEPNHARIVEVQLV